MFSLSSARRFVRMLGVLVLAAATLGALAPLASAGTGPPDPGPAGTVPIPPPATPPAASGLPLWAAAAISIGALVLGAGLALAAVSARRARHPHIPAPPASGSPPAERCERANDHIKGLPAASPAAHRVAASPPVADTTERR
jgi:hypothetical protein